MLMTCGLPATLNSTAVFLVLPKNIFQSPLLCLITEKSNMEMNRRYEKLDFCCLIRLLGMGDGPLFVCVEDDIYP